jgi:ABC-type enterobactin transport system permease subunit
LELWVSSSKADAELEWQQKALCHADLLYCLILLVRIRKRLSICGLGGRQHESLGVRIEPVFLAQKSAFLQWLA